MIRAILFDIDGTLTLMDQDEFMKNYIGMLAPRFAHLLPPDRFAKQVMRSTEVMVYQPQQGKTNLQTFFDDFTKATGISFNTLWPIFEAFYENDFSALRCLTKLNPEGKRVVECAVKQGYVVTVAANPVMPLTAMKERIGWADLSPDIFRLVPSIENFHFCKPQTGFFEEITQKLGVYPSECLMVGNHPLNDMIGSKIGMKTFLVGDTFETIKPNYQGDLSLLLDLILQGNL